MSHFLTELPLWQLILAVIVIPTAIAIGFQVLVRRWVGIERLVLNNEVAGFIFAIIGVVYAVLLAFVIIAVWEKFSEGQTSVARESPPPPRCSTMRRAPSGEKLSGRQTLGVASGELRREPRLARANILARSLHPSPVIRRWVMRTAKNQRRRSVDRCGKERCQRECQWPRKLLFRWPSSTIWTSPRCGQQLIRSVGDARLAR